MTRALAKRVMALEGGPDTGIDICADVPAAWPRERQVAEVEAIAVEHGISGPFGLVVLRQHFFDGLEEAQITFAGMLGVHSRLPEPWRRNHEQAG